MHCEMRCIFLTSTLTKRNSNMQLTKNFSLTEFVQSATAARLGIYNTPSAKELENIKKTAEYLQIIRDEIGVGIYITSGFRCEKLNKVVKGSPTSAHRYGSAVDIHAIGLTSTQLALKIVDIIKAGKIPFDQLILEFPGTTSTWVHLGFRHNSVMRSQYLTASRIGGKTRYSPGIKTTK